MVSDGMCSKMTSDEIILKHFFHFHIESGRGEERRNFTQNVKSLT